VTIYAYCVAGALVLLGGIGIARSRNLVHAVVCLSVSQSGTYVLLLAIGYQKGALAPVFGSTSKPSKFVVDPVVRR
jgi:multicomponent Na+:H+ antiporter subunit C